MLDKKLIDLIEEYNPLKECLMEDMSLYHDLNIYGDDADELLIKYSEMFNVSLSSFNFKDYFPFEGDEFVSAIIRFFTRKKRPELKRLTISHLQDAIELKELK